jgi:hypothetical protein
MIWSEWRRNRQQVTKTPRSMGRGGVIAQSETGLARNSGGPEGMPTQTVYAVTICFKVLSNRKELI